MLKQLLAALFCSVIFIAKLHAQEVIVAREKKPEAPKPTVQPVKQAPAETPTPAPRRTKAHEKKSPPATLTLEEMRAAGIRAAEGTNDQSVPRSNEVREPESQSPRKRVETEIPKPAKRETPVEERRSSHSSKSRSTNVEGVGPIRPTMIESGREGPSPSPSGR